MRRLEERMQFYSESIEYQLEKFGGSDEEPEPFVAATIVKPLEATPSASSSTSTSTYVLGFGSVLALAAIGIAVMNKEKEEKDYHEKLLSAYIDDETR